MSALNKISFSRKFTTQLSEYITAIAWSPLSNILAIATGSGQLLIWSNNQIITLLEESGNSIDAIAFSPKHPLLASAGQDGQIRIWSIQPEPKLITTINHTAKWIDQLAWHPDKLELAYSIGSYLQVWDLDQSVIATTLDFESSTILGISYRPNGTHIAVAGNNGAKIWDTQNWDNDPYLIPMSAASIAIAWSGDSQYLASANIDLTITLSQWSNPYPWVMKGFPGKIRKLTWSDKNLKNAPVLASCSAEGVIVWIKQGNDEEGWGAQVLELHEKPVIAIAFQPQSLLLASASEDGSIGLWKKSHQLVQVLEGAPQGFSSIAWNSQGNLLAAGGSQGEIIIWSLSTAGKGF